MRKGRLAVDELVRLQDKEETTLAERLSIRSTRLRLLYGKSGVPLTASWFATWGRRTVQAAPRNEKKAGGSGAAGPRENFGFLQKNSENFHSKFWLSFL